MHQKMWGTSFDFLALVVAVNTVAKNPDHGYLDAHMFLKKFGVKMKRDIWRG